MPTESAKTMTYVAIAAVMALAGIFLAPGGPKAAKDGVESLIGTEFYKNFTNPSEATAIDVIGYDAATATTMPFSVEYKDGLWRIPTRNNYPADAKDRLAKVASSVIGLKREALAGRSESEQAEFQVLDPKSGEKSDNLKGIGNRVTLRNGNTVLADFIIGKQVPNRPGYYYVRKPDEKATFIAKVELNLSTKFTDWIESDVLNLEGSRLTKIDILKHTLELTRGGARLTGKEENILTRKNSTDPWQLEGLDEEKEEVNQDEVRKLVTALDDLKIVGVRPKPESLRKDLQSDEGIKLDRETAEDLTDKGFVIMSSPRGGGVQMVSMEGDLTAGTDQGVEYEMHFGNVFEASEEDIELGGFAKPAASDDSAPADAEKKPEDQKDESSEAGKKKGRFIFVTARVNPNLFGPALEEPVKPEAPNEEPKKEEEKPGASDEKSEEKKADDKPAEESKETAEPEKVDPQKAYEEALKKYELDKVKYEADLAARDVKVKEAEEKIKTLNARFADWYYVISGESFENIRQGRKTLVKEKPEPEKPEMKEDEESGEKKEDAKEEPAKKEEKPTAEKPAPEKPAAEKPKAETPKTGAPKAAAPKTETPKAAQPKTETPKPKK